MTQTEYNRLGYVFPPCEIAYFGLGDDPKAVTIKHNGVEEDFLVEIRGTPSVHDILYLLIFEQANLATMYLRDFVREWPNQTYCGRRDAIREWRRLRHQRRKLKRLFGDDCP